MIAVACAPLPMAKRQKISHSPTPWIRQQDDETCSLCEVEDSTAFLEEEDEYIQENVEREEKLLDKVLALYEQYEEDSLFQQSTIRFQISSSQSDVKTEVLLNNLEDEKAKCNILKVLTLLLQSESRLRGSTHLERMGLLRRVKAFLLEAGYHSLNRLKKSFVNFFTSRQETLFPPSAVFVPNCFPTSLGNNYPAAIEESQLIRKTRELISCLRDASKKAIQQRLEQENFSEMEEQDWDNMSDVWNAWLQFKPISSNQLAIWEESLRDGDNIDSLLWNLALYLSQEGS
mmetsp:Transcript_30032/g.45543  ORF Transcript_30032/g.45543 Transcript_30032/m.45543 type:complete len:288 (+) Transcript_30032:337-1200(+)